MRVLDWTFKSIRRLASLGGGLWPKDLWLDSRPNTNTVDSVDSVATHNLRNKPNVITQDARVPETSDTYLHDSSAMTFNVTKDWSQPERHLEFRTILDPEDYKFTKIKFHTRTSSVLVSAELSRDCCDFRTLMPFIVKINTFTRFFIDYGVDTVSYVHHMAAKVFSREEGSICEVCITRVFNIQRFWDVINTRGTRFIASYYPLYNTRGGRNKSPQDQVLVNKNNKILVARHGAKLFIVFVPQSEYKGHVMMLKDVFLHELHMSEMIMGNSRLKHSNNKVANDARFTRKMSGKHFSLLEFSDHLIYQFVDPSIIAIPESAIKDSSILHLISPENSKSIDAATVCGSYRYTDAICYDNNGLFVSLYDLGVPVKVSESICFLWGSDMVDKLCKTIKSIASLKCTQQEQQEKSMPTSPCPSPACTLLLSDPNIPLTCSNPLNKASDKPMLQRSVVRKYVVQSLDEDSTEVCSVNTHVHRFARYISAKHPISLGFMIMVIICISAIGIITLSKFVYKHAKILYYS